MDELWPLPGVGATVVGGFESTYQPLYGVDGFRTSGHDRHWRRDLDALFEAGVRHVRYPIRWPSIEREPGVYDWTETDEVMAHLHERGAVVIADLVHHTSYPGWLRGGLLDPSFAPAYLRYVAAVAERYPWLPAYTLLNEPFVTTFLCSHEGVWHPFARGIQGFLTALRSVLPALRDAEKLLRKALPQAHHVWIDSAEAHSGVDSGAGYAELANDRRHIVLDLFCGNDLDRDRPFLKELLAAGGEDLLELDHGRVDLLGLDYYPQSEWFYDDDGAHSPSPQPVGLAEVVRQYWARYHLPMMITETNVRGLPTDKVSWLKHVLEQYEVALADGLPLHGLCWFPQLDSIDWDSMLSLSLNRVDPVGVWSVSEDGRRRPTVFTQEWTRVVAGAPAKDLPAYPFEHPCKERLSGFAPLMAHWSWLDVGRHNRLALRHGLAEQDPGPLPGDERKDMPRPPRQPMPDLVVLSHLRWPWVWQRPQHLVSRLAASRAMEGAMTFFVEEPLQAEVTEPELQVERVGDVGRVVLLVPKAEDGVYRGCAEPDAADYPTRVADLLGKLGAKPGLDAWLYTPMALPFLATLKPGLVVYDVMDDLASFAKAPQGLRDRQLELLAIADVVFTGGRSLHRSTTGLRTSDVHLFASGVETDHYAQAKQARRRDGSERKVAGYIGVIDERLDLQLIADLADELSDWTIRIVGPVAKIEESDLPQRPNLEYPGMVDYKNLPQEMARLDVALMPFALNEATTKISPTKTLEYFAAGLPVVSTRVPDVLADYGDAVHFADDAAGFADSCRRAAGMQGELSPQIEELLRCRGWDFIADAMRGLVESTRSRGDTRRAGWRETLWTGSAPSLPEMLGDLAEAHRLSVRAATEGIQDPSLGSRRLDGDRVPALAEAAVVSATPYLRAPLLARMQAVTALHPDHDVLGDGHEPALCPTCGVPVPCPTAKALQ